MPRPTPLPVILTRVRRFFGQVPSDAAVESFGGSGSATTGAAIIKPGFSKIWERHRRQRDGRRHPPALLQRWTGPPNLTINVNVAGAFVGATTDEIAKALARHIRLELLAGAGRRERSGWRESRP
jgi:hypothetical protein